MMSKGNYLGESQIKVPFNFSFISKLSSDAMSPDLGDPYHLQDYTKKDVEDLLVNPGLNRDLGRTHWLLGKNLALFTGGFGETTHVHDEKYRAEGFKAFVKACASNGITLSIEEAEALYAFVLSAKGKWLQGGIVHASFIVFILGLLPYFGIRAINPDKDTFLQQTAEHQFSFGLISSVKDYFIDDTQIQDVKINLVDADLKFTMTFQDGVFHIAAEEDSIIYIEKGFWDQLTLKVIDRLKEEAPKLDNEAIGFITPFLIDKNIASKYMLKISNQPELLASASEFIILCYKNDDDYKDYLLTKLSLTAHLKELQKKIDRLVTVEYKKASMENIYVQADMLEDDDRKAYFNKISFNISAALKAVDSNDSKRIIKESHEIPSLNLEMAKINLDDALRSDDCDSMLAVQAKVILEEISALDKTVRMNNIDLITDTVNQMSIAIDKPQNLNMEKAQTLLRALDNTSWGKVIAGSLVVLFSAALLTLSIGAAIASFGASSFVSALGMGVAVNLVTQLFSIGVGASALVAAGAGAKLVSTSKPLHQLAKASQSFWKIAETKVIENASVSLSALEPSADSVSINNSDLSTIRSI